MDTQPEARGEQPKRSTRISRVLGFNALVNRGTDGRGDIHKRAVVTVRSNAGPAMGAMYGGEQGEYIRDVLRRGAEEGPPAWLEDSPERGKGRYVPKSHHTDV